MISRSPTFNSSNSSSYSLPGSTEEDDDLNLYESKRRKYNSHESLPKACDDEYCPESLMDLSSKICASVMSYGAVEERCNPVPEPVMKKLIFWAFPRCEVDIRRYSSACWCCSTAWAGHNEREKCMFEKGVFMAQTGKVKEILQLGFYIVGKVEDDSGQVMPRQVSMTFDRCKITSATCDCKNNDMLFCTHVIALAVFRIRKPHLVTIRPPISDTLQLLDRNQLRKLTQYIIAKHDEVLMTVQTIADSLTNSESDINLTEGAPDPTAGAGPADDDKWALDERQIKLWLSNLLKSNTVTQIIVKEVEFLVIKVRNMLWLRDRNGPCLLAILTEELVTHVVTYNTNYKPCIATWRAVWNDIGILWECVVLNPKPEDLTELARRFDDWKSRIKAAREYGGELAQAELSQLVQPGHSIFSFPIKLLSITWDVGIEQNIFLQSSPICKAVESFESDTVMHYENISFLWFEPLHIAIARIEALKCHGYIREAKVLACSVALTIKYNNDHVFYTNDLKRNLSAVLDTQSTVFVEKAYRHPFELIQVLFDTLMNVQQLLGENAIENRTAVFKYECLAFEIALLSLANRTYAASSWISDQLTIQKRGILAEESLIRRLRQFCLNEDMLLIIYKIGQSLLLKISEFKLCTETEKIFLPFYNFARYLFENLQNHDLQLSFRIGIQALENPMPRDISMNSDLFTSNYHHERYFTQHHQSVTPKCFLKKQLETDKCDLASSLIQSAEGHLEILREVFECTCRNIQNSYDLLRLSNDASATAKLFGVPDGEMLNVSLQFCKQALELTTIHDNLTREEMITQLVFQAAECGLSAILSLVEYCYDLFTPAEATTELAQRISSTVTADMLMLDRKQKIDLQKRVCRMAIECTKNDPKASALPCLELCEKDSQFFDEAYDVILYLAKNNRMEADELYNIARYLEQREYVDKALTVSCAAASRLRMGIDDDNHPLKNDLIWTVEHAFGKPSFVEVMFAIKKGIESPTILSEVLKICTSEIDAINNANHVVFSSYNPTLQTLVEKAISGYVEMIPSKIRYISCRKYDEFISYLEQAHNTFLMAPNGRERFEELKHNLKVLCGTKKKLLNLINHHFN